MPSPATGVDHLLILVNDLDTASDNMARLGFTVSPRGFHSPHLGSANHTIMFQQDYLELWGVVTPTELNAVHRANLARGEGVHTAALTAIGIDGVVTSLAAAGIRTDPPVQFTRPVELPDGSGEASFTIVRPDKDQLPNGFMFFCQHHTRDVVWVPQWMEHANTAQGIEAVVIEADRPEDAAHAYAPLFTAGGPVAMPGGMKLPSGKADLEFLTPAEIARRYGGAGVAEVRSPHYKVTRIGVADMTAAARTLRQASIRFQEADGRLLVHPAEANGVLFEFVAQA